MWGELASEFLGGFSERQQTHHKQQPSIYTSFPFRLPTKCDAIPQSVEGIDAKARSWQSGIIAHSSLNWTLDLANLAVEPCLLSPYQDDEVMENRIISQKSISNGIKWEHIHNFATHLPPCNNPPARDEAMGQRMILLLKSVASAQPQGYDSTSRNARKLLICFS